MIQVSGLSKTVSGTRLAVDNVSFDVKAGEVFGLLGPNGAGKTTTLRMLATLLKPSSGTATLNGFEITREPGKVRERIGFLSGDMGLYGRLTPIEILDFFGRLNGMEETRRKSRIQFLLTKFDMQSFAGVRTDKLSTEMMGTIPLDAHTLTPIGVTLIPLAMFAASLMFAIALFARSYKEGQSYLTPWRWW